MTTLHTALLCKLYHGFRLGSISFETAHAHNKALSKTPDQYRFTFERLYARPIHLCFFKKSLSLLFYILWSEIQSD